MCYFTCANVAFCVRLSYIFKCIYILHIFLASFACDYSWLFLFYSRTIMCAFFFSVSSFTSFLKASYFLYTMWLSWLKFYFFIFSHPNSLKDIFMCSVCSLCPVSCWFAFQCASRHCISTLPHIFITLYFVFAPTLLSSSLFVRFNGESSLSLSLNSLCKYTLHWNSFIHNSPTSQLLLKKNENAISQCYHMYVCIIYALYFAVYIFSTCGRFSQFDV